MRVPRLQPDPLGIPRNPFQVYLLCLAIAAGIPLLFGVPTAGSLEASLPRFQVVIWGLMLVLGSSTTLVGMYWPGHPASGLLIKRTGLVSVGSAAFVYTSVLVLYFGVRAGLVIVYTLGFAVACFVQAHYINRHIKAVIKATP